MTEYLPIFKQKFGLLTKFMQAGKTGYMQDEIKRLAETGGDYFHIIFCSNNLFLTNQTGNRIQKTFTDLNEKIDTNHIAQNLKAVVCSSFNKKCNRLGHLVMQLKNYRAILCCSHKKRFQLILELLETGMLNSKKVYIWVDEMHMDLNMIYKNLLRYCKYPCIEKIIGISATPDSIFRKVGDRNCEINILPTESCDKSLYYGFDDCVKTILDINEYNIPEDFYEENQYLNKKAITKDGSIVLSGRIENALYLNTILMNDSVVYDNDDVFFVPGSRYKVSHQAIKDVLISHGFYTFVFNSDGTYLYFENDEFIDLKKDQAILQATTDDNGNILQCSLGHLMGIAKDLFKLDDRPIGITGYLSVGQGNTLCDYDTDFYITKGIFGYKNALVDFTTQVTGRIFGNLKQRREFNGCEMIMRPVFKEQVSNNILSGAFSEYALKTGKIKMSQSDLPLIKQRMKISFRTGSIKKDTHVKFDAKNTTKHVPIEFHIPKELIELLKNGKNYKRTFMEYLRNGKIPCPELLEKIDENYYFNAIWRVLEKSGGKSKFTKMQECYQRNKRHKTSIREVDYKKTGKVVFIGVDLRNDEGLCYACYSHDKRFS